MRQIGITNFVVVLVAWLLLLPNGFAKAAYQDVTEANPPVRFAIVLPAPPAMIHQQWQPLADYLAEKLARPVELVTPQGLDAVAGMVASASVDFLFLNPYLLNILMESAHVVPIAQMQNVTGSIYSSGRFLVKRDSDIHNVTELRGKKIALISPLGALAYLAPRAYLSERGIDIDKDMEIVYTQNLKKAAYMVMLGEADAAVMCRVNYELLSKKIQTGELKILDTTDSFPESAIVAREGLDPQLIAQFAQAILNADDPKAKQAMVPLQEMKIEKFIPYDASVEQIITQARKR